MLTALLAQSLFESFPILYDIEQAVRNARGVIGLVVIFVYSFLIAFVLPLPSEVVLLAPLDFGLSQQARWGLIILVSASGKALGSVVALRLGHEAKEYGPLLRAIKRSRFDLVAWSETKTIQIAEQYGYIGLAMALSVPFFPDTLSIYAFTVLEEDYVKFAAATFAGSAGRLLVTIGLGSGAVAIWNLIPF